MFLSIFSLNINEWNREDWRRVSLRTSAAILSAIIGPAGAWTLGQEMGLAIYICMSTFSKTIVAEISAFSQKIAIWNYQFSTFFLVFAGIIGGFFPNSFISTTIIVPIFLGAYVGAYWTSRWGLAQERKERDSSGRNLVHSFQKIEIYASLLAAFLIFLLLPFDGLISIVGGSIAFIALCLPLAKEDLNARLNRTTERREKPRELYGKMISHLFAIMQFTVGWSMRYFMLDIGGVTSLALLIAGCAWFGYILDQIGKMRAKPSKDETKESGMNTEWIISSWKIGNRVCGLGIVALMIGAYFVQIFIFVFGYLLYTIGSSGINRKNESSIGRNFLKGDDAIGARERVKFRAHSFVVLFFVLYVCLFFPIFQSMELFLISALILALTSVLAQIGIEPYFVKHYFESNLRLLE